ncbi:Bax inhibitor-1/YccA family protein [Rubidibacter lacunae]|nr:Bax inhibitor-1 family protein [Rubidibacter lacunae]
MVIAASARPSERAEFIQKTYLHLAGAVAAFIVFEFLLFETGIAQGLTALLFGNGGLAWLLVLGAFMLIGWLSRGLAARADDTNLQYLGLGLYVFIQGIIFAPMLFVAHTYFQGENIIATAGVLTVAMFGGLTAIAFTTGKDFTFLGGILRIAGFVALGLIVCSLIFGFSLGLWFSAAMIIFASGAILYDTSNVLHHFQTHQHVAAALELFASVALLFWYILRLLMQLSRN